MSRGYRIEGKSTEQLFLMPLNTTLDTIVFWFRSENQQPVTALISFKEKVNIAEEFFSMLLNYLLYTIVGEVNKPWGWIMESW